MIKEFEKLNINWSILEVIKEKKFESPTNIQKKVIPLSLENKNIIAASPTGSGKTLAYLVNIIQKTRLNKNNLQSIIIAPTRELVNQIGKNTKEFSKHKQLKISIITGSQKINQTQYNKIIDSHVLIITPGMLIEYIEKYSLDLSYIETLILDEADTLITSEFKENIEQIIKQIPRTRQTMFFSATITPEIAKLANKYMRNPVKIFAGTKVDNKKMKQFIYEIEPNKKLSLLIYLLKNQKFGIAICFVNRTQTAKFVEKNIKKQGFKTALLHGEISKGKRNKIFENFNKQKYDILITTDVSARGLDFENVSHIFNYNIPSDEIKYIHRIGRTARAGKTGEIINLVSKKDTKHLLNIINKKHIHLIYKTIPNNLELIKTVN